MKKYHFKWIYWEAWLNVTFGLIFGLPPWLYDFWEARLNLIRKGEC